MKRNLILVLLFSSLIGNSQFGLPIRISKPSAINVNAIDMGDLDGDGIADLVVASGWGPNYGKEKLSWFKNYGNNTFIESVVLSTKNDQANVVKCADIDLDGDIDIVYSDFRVEGNPPFVSDNYCNLYVLFNDGFGQFEETIVLENTKSLINFFLNDVNLDGFNDIIITNAFRPTILDTSFAGYLLNDGYGAFTQYIEVCQSPNYWIKWAGRLNTDSISDFIQVRQVSPTTDSVQIMYSVSPGIYSPTTLVEIGDSFRYVNIIEDINNDGFVDLLYNKNGIRARFGESTYTWGQELVLYQNETMTESSYLHYVDIDRNGVKDILTGGKIYFMDSLVVNSIINTAIYPIYINDLEQERVYFILAPSSLDPISYTYVDGDTAVVPIVITNEFQSNHNVDQIKDLNSDGNMDFSSTEFIYLSNTESQGYDKIYIGHLGALNPEPHLFADWDFNSLLFCDLNSDSNSDIVYFHSNGGLYYAFGNNAYEYTSPALIDPSDSFNVADLIYPTINYVNLFNSTQDKFLVVTSNNDVAGNSAPLNKIKIFRHFSNQGLFTLDYTNYLPQTLLCFDIVDFGLDSNFDFIYFDYYSHQVFVQKNSGSFPFQIQSYLVDTSWGFHNLIVADFNSDGLQDFSIILNLNNTVIKVLTYTYNSITGGFDLDEEIQTQNQDLSPSLKCILSDVDCDSDFDLVFSDLYTYPSLFYLERDGDNYITEFNIINDSLFGGFHKLNDVDFDGDGDVDLIVGSTNTRQLYLFENNCSLLTNIFVPDIEGDDEFLIVPNPVNDDEILIHSIHDNLCSFCNFRLFTYDGKIVEKGILDFEGRTFLKGSHLSGVYFIEIKDSNSKTHILKFIKI